jgi:predicted 3-demethylubiquinone-9 3-methyltransferase (glyoxalase superfamily)
MDADMTNKATLCLWFNDDAEEAARFYAETFPDSAVGAIARAPGEKPDALRWQADDFWRLSADRNIGEIR